MAKHTIKGFLVYETLSWQNDADRVQFQSIEPWDGQDAVLIAPHEFEVEVPDNFDPRPQQIKELQAQQKKAAADFAKLCTDIARQISELTCLEAA